MKNAIGLVLSVALTSAALADPDYNTALLKLKGHLTTTTLKEVQDGQKGDLKFAEGESPIEGDVICLHPDKYDKEVAEADPATLAEATGFTHFQCRAVIQMQKRLKSHLDRGDRVRGSGSWPSGCYAERPNNHLAKYYIDYSTFPSKFSSVVSDEFLQGLADVKVWGTLEEIKSLYAGKSYMEAFKPLLEITNRRVGCYMTETEDHAAANIHVAGEEMPGGLAGYAFFNDGTCGDHVNLRMDTLMSPGHSFLGVFGHEFGHTLNLPHEFGTGPTGGTTTKSLMSYNRHRLYGGYATGSDASGRPKDASLDRLARYFGPQIPDPPPGPDPPPVPPGPTPPGPTDGIVIRVGSEFVIEVGNARVTATATKIDGVAPESLQSKIKKEFAKIPVYPARINQAESLAIVYRAVGKALADKKITAEQAKNAVAELTTLILGNDADKWIQVVLLASTANTAELMAEVANGLSSAAINETLEQLIEFLIGQIQDERFKLIAKIILAFLKADDVIPPDPNPNPSPTPGKRVITIIEETGDRSEHRWLAPLVVKLQTDSELAKHKLQILDKDVSAAKEWADIASEKGITLPVLFIADANEVVLYVGPCPETLDAVKAKAKEFGG